MYFKSLLSLIENRVLFYSLWVSHDVTLPIYKDCDSVKCRDFDMDTFDFKKLKVERTKIFEKIVPITVESNTHMEYCDMV
jgi:hypothetical protein